MGPKWWPQWAAVTTCYDEGDNDKEVDDSNKERIAAVERDFKHQTRQPTDHFEKLRESTCPNHAYPIRHKLKECPMMKNYMTTGAFAKGKKPEDDSTGKAAAPFPEEKAVRSIYGGPAPHESRHKLKITSWAVNTVSLATSDYLCWFESPIIIDQMDHPDSIPKLGRFSLIVDSLVKMTWLTKALVDGAVASTSCTTTPSKG
jgi:hypothetical protein